MKNIMIFFKNIFYIFFDIFDIFDNFQKMKISNKLHNNGCNTLIQYLMTILVTSHLYYTLIVSFSGMRL